MTIVSLLMGIAASVGFTSLMAVMNTQKVLRIWVASIWINTLGITLIGLRNHIPDVLSIVLGNGLLVTGNILTLRGIKQHLGRPMRWRWPILLALVYTGAIAWFAFGTPNLGARLLAGSLQAMAFNLAYAYLLLRYAEPDIRKSCRIAGVVLLVNGLFYLVRSFVPMNPEASQNLMLAGVPVAATYVIGILTTLASYFALLQLITERLMVDLRRAARTDGLTGLLNRSAIVAEGREALERCQERGQSFALMIFDLDYFKQINDRWGHDAGDAVLRHVSQQLREAIQWPHYLSSRYGGEEFVVALPGATLDQGLAAAERLRHALAHSHARFSNQSIPVTASIGVAVARSGTRFEHLVRQADHAMYRSKSDGRNGVSAADDLGGRLAQAGDSRC
ncbi:GGDEF domain-containing protein [Dyella telluris]|uniref:diguanylate cyclase n=1 Tax=Dyella telluris TaxID=2763498 RepID=A0A7G8Q6Y1_9GAMM|nr:GGDEF domain-containing protein [Dyella telluris]QNK02539.1 GGDEF domain-containing protein [Dyella telluris]